MQSFRPNTSSKGHKLSIAAAVIAVLTAATCIVLWAQFSPGPGSNMPYPSTFMEELLETSGQTVCVIVGIIALLCFAIFVGLAIKTRAHEISAQEKK